MPAEGNTCRKAAWSRRLSSICFVRMATNLSDCPNNSSNVLRARNCKSISPASIRNLMESRRASAPRLNATGCSKRFGCDSQIIQVQFLYFHVQSAVHIFTVETKVSFRLHLQQFIIARQPYRATADFNPAFRFTPDRFQRAYCSSSSLASTRAVV